MSDLKAKLLAIGEGKLHKSPISIIIGSGHSWGKKTESVKGIKRNEGIGVGVVNRN